MRRVFFFISLLISSLLISTSCVYAAGNEFSTALTSTYTVAENGATHVEQVFQIKNNFSTIYVTEYALEVGSNRIRNVSAISGTTALTPTVTPRGNKTSISFLFPDKVVGKDHIREFTVSYDTDDAATKTGNVLEVSIPKLANPSEFSSYIVHVTVDNSFGSPALASPSTFSTQTENGKNTVTFTNVGQQTGISVIFGKKQIVRFSLTYHIENPTGQKGNMTIALPPDTGHQRVYYTSVVPQPKEITQDQDGNWLASYELAAGEKQTIIAQGMATLSLSSQLSQPQSEQDPGNNYLNSSPHWPINDASIRELVKTLKTPKDIYDYVVKTLSYDYTRLEGGNKRLGAVGALKAPQNSVCTEFTDLFITLARAAGIPAREINGYAYTQNETLRPLSLVRDVLHAWPQYWDASKKQWINVDPTWGNTTGGVDYFSHLDFNHIVFAIHGTSSEQPLPAGTYKFVGEDTKDIALTFVSDIPPQENDVQATVSLRPTLFFSPHSPYSVRVRSKSLHAIYDIPYIIRATLPSGDSVNTNGTISLLPLGKKEIPIEVPGSNLFSNRSITIDTQVEDHIFTEHINAQSFITQHRRAIIITLSVGSAICVVALITRRLLVPRWKR
jgi:transglutaminase-like putative cysteine protease